MNLYIIFLLTFTISCNQEQDDNSYARSSDLIAISEQFELLVSEITSLELKLDELNAKLDLIKSNASFVPLWLYDGNGEKKFKVISFSGEGEVIVDLGNERFAVYTIVGSHLLANRLPHDATIWFESSDCTGQAYVCEAVSVGFLGKNQIFVFPAEDQANDQLYSLPISADAVEKTVSSGINGFGLCNSGSGSLTSICYEIPANPIDADQYRLISPLYVAQ